MKKGNFKILVIIIVAGIMFFSNACTKNLLDQAPTSELGSDQFWKTEADATTALMGLYSTVRPLFDRDYYFDGQSEYFISRGNATSTGDLQSGAAYNGGIYTSGKTQYRFAET